VTVASGATLRLFDILAGSQSDLAIGNLSGGGNINWGAARSPSRRAAGSLFSGVISGSGN
jgi:hypothetical protein